jgi:hypothetical protein
MTLVAGIDLGKTSCRVRAARDGHHLGTAEVPGARGLADPGAWMVDVQASHHKLRSRAVRMLREATGVSDTAAREALEAADWRPTTALVALLTGVDVGSAARALDAEGGRARDAVQRLRGAG